MNKKMILMCTAILTLPSLCAAVEAEDWISLFNGKNLDGWEATGQAEWSVQDGLLIGTQTTGQGGDLVTRQEWQDFELRFVYRVDWPANSGMWFRYDKEQKKGYQFDILKYTNPVAFSGTLYCPGKMFLTRNLDESLENRDDWNEGTIRARGQALTLTLNGHTVGACRDDTLARGRFGIQVHPGDGFKGMRIAFKKIELRPLATGEPDAAFIDDQLTFAQAQLMSMARALGRTDRIPRSVKDGEIELKPVSDWTSGFFAGSLWYAYAFSGDAAVKAQARQFTEILEPVKDKTNTHDLGFMIYCSYGNGLRLTADAGYRDIVLHTARTLSRRYNAQVGCIRSWDFGSWTYPVIIDNMMNLELLFWAARTSGDATLRDMAVSHARTTQAHHFRDDASTWHVVDYDPETGAVRGKCTHQGYADETAWARGQSWGLYGYTMTYRETRDPAFLQQARKIAQCLLNHPNLPADKVPYWDYNAPNIPDEPRDASAGAIMCSALIELSQLAKDPIYLAAADEILMSLASPAYRAQAVGDNHHFILKHSVGNKPGGSEIDTPINYADYYFVEALMRRRALLRGEK
jgi:hypothetical protein